MNSVLPRPEPDEEPPRHPPGRDVTMLRGFLVVLMIAMAVATVWLWVDGPTSTSEAVMVAIAWGLMVGAYVLVGHLPPGRR